MRGAASPQARGGALDLDSPTFQKSMLPTILTACAAVAAFAPPSITMATPHALGRASNIAMTAPTLREQMLAYIKSAQERGVELTDEQKAIIAEFEEDDEVLDETGRPDFMKNAQVMTSDEFSQQTEAASAAPPVAAPAAVAPAAVSPAAPPAVSVSAAASASMAAAGPAIDATAARLWLAQRSERDSACALLSQIAEGTTLSEPDTRYLRSLLTSLVSTVAQVG